MNSIWEGSGNVQCLDMLRAMNRNKGSLEAFFTEMKKSAGKNELFDKALADLHTEFSDLSDIEYRARTIVSKMAIAFQALPDAARSRRFGSLLSGPFEW